MFLIKQYTTFNNNLKHKKMEIKNFVTLNKAAEMIGINRSTLYIWIRDGIIKKEIFGKTPLISIDEINRILKK